MVEQELRASVEDVTKHLGITKDTIYPRSDSVSLLVRRVGYLCRFKPSQVNAWVEAGGAAAGLGDEGGKR